MTTKKSNSKNIGYRIACLVLGLVMGAGITVGVSAACGLYDTPEEADTTVEENAETSGFIIDDSTSQSNGIKLSSLAVAADSSASYESSYEITATITPTDATSQTVTWSLAWSSTSSATISSYVTLSSTTSTSGSSITVYCLQPFSTQLTLTATADDVTASVTLDYVKRYNAFTYDSTNTASSDYILDSSVTGYAGVNLFTYDSVVNTVALYSGFDPSATGTGSTTESYNQSSVKLTFAFTSNFITILQTYVPALYSSASGSYTISASQTSTSYTMDDILAGIFGISSNKMSNCYAQFYNAFKNAYRSIPVFTVTATFTGTILGETYSIDCSCYMEYDGWYTSASAVALTGDSAVYF